MSATYIAGAALVASMCVALFAVMTWRRALARRASIVALLMLVVLSFLTATGGAWLDIVGAILCAPAIALLVRQELKSPKAAGGAASGWVLRGSAERPLR